MGVSLSWIGVRGVSKDALLERLGLSDTGRPVDDLPDRHGCAGLPGGWTVILSQDLDFMSDRIAEASIGGLAVGCAMEEHLMFSEARALQDGAELWRVSHDPDRSGVYDLALDGDPPPELAGIRKALTSEQDEGGGEDAGVDRIFDAPIQLVALLCGYRPDEETAGTDPPTCTELDRRCGEPGPGPEPPAVQPPGPGLLQMFAGLFGKRG